MNFKDYENKIPVPNAFDYMLDPTKMSGKIDRTKYESDLNEFRDNLARLREKFRVDLLDHYKLPDTCRTDVLWQHIQETIDDYDYECAATEFGELLKVIEKYLEAWKEEVR